MLCSYDVDCNDIADMRTRAGRAENRVRLEQMACAWFSFVADGMTPPSWQIAQRLIAAGAAGALVPSFAPDATDDDDNLVLWQWSEDLPPIVQVFDPRSSRE